MKSQKKEKKSSTPTVQTKKGLPSEQVTVLPEATTTPEPEKVVERRGRPKGSTNKPKPVDVKVPVAKLIINLTETVARMNNIPELATTKEEADVFEEGFNYFLDWLNTQVPKVAKYTPALYIILPTGAYFTRVAIALRHYKKSKDGYTTLDGTQHVPLPSPEPEKAKTKPKKTDITKSVKVENV